MSPLRRARWGSFAKPIEDLLPILGVSPEQIDAASDPRRSSKSLAAESKPRVTKREINGVLDAKRVG